MSYLVLKGSYQLIEVQFIGYTSIWKILKLIAILYKTYILAILEIGRAHV